MTERRTVTDWCLDEDEMTRVIDEIRSIAREPQPQDIGPATYNRFAEKYFRIEAVLGRANLYTRSTT